MSTSKGKKPDRRTLYTRKVICEAFLHLKRTVSYDSITVAAICREAEISRGTFYLHYNNIAEVLDDVLTTALSQVTTLQDQLYPYTCTGERKCQYPLCQYIRCSKDYRCLFYDEALYFQILSKIFATYKQGTFQMWRDKTNLPPEQIEMLAYFQLSGCFAAAVKSGSMTNEKWGDVRENIDSFIRFGIQAFSKPE